jgi:hypothetical protein
MKDSEDFRCHCGNGIFTKKSAFVIDYRTVNFTDELIYDIKNIVRYECDMCGAMYKEEEIQDILKNMIKRYKEDYWEERNK